MQSSVSDLKQFRSYGLDGEFGVVKDLLIDPQTWLISKALIKQRGALGLGSEVLIDRAAFLDSAVKGVFGVNYTVADLKQLSHVKSDTEITSSDVILGGMDLINSVIHSSEIPSHENLVAYSTLTDYKITTLDGDVGTVSHVIIDTKKWCVPFLVINLFQGDREVLAPTHFLVGIDQSSKVINYSDYSDVLEHAPVFDYEAYSKGGTQKIAGHFLKYSAKSNRRMRNEGFPAQ